MSKVTILVTQISSLRSVVKGGSFLLIGLRMQIQVTIVVTIILIFVLTFVFYVSVIF